MAHAEAAQRRDQDEIADQVDADRPDGEPHRRPGVAAGVEAGGQHLDQHVGGQADRESRKRPAAQDRIARGEGAVLEEAADDRLGGEDEGGGGGQGEEEGELDAAILRVHRLRVLAAC